MMPQFKIGDEVGVRTELGLIVRGRITGRRDDGKFVVKRFNGCGWATEEVGDGDHLTTCRPMPADRELYESQVPTSERESTTFTQDFRIAEAYGVAAIRDTYRRAFAAWKSQYKYLTELTMVLNHRLHHWFYVAGEDDERTKLYSRLWDESFEWGKANLKGDELYFFLSVLD